MTSCPNCPQESCACTCNCNQCAIPFRVSYYPYCPSHIPSKESFASYTVSPLPDSDGSLILPVQSSGQGNLISLPANSNTITLFPGYAYFISYQFIGNSSGFSVTPVINGTEMQNARAVANAVNTQQISASGSLIVPANSTTTLAFRLRTLTPGESVMQLSGNISVFPITKLC